MANVPTIGVFIPGPYLNRSNSPYPTGAGDVYGNIYPTGLNPGKVIEIGDAQANNLTSPASSDKLFGGAYQWIQVDSGATAANVGPGRAAFLKLDPGGTAGVQPETGYQGMIVTSQDQADANSLYSGVFIEAIPPGNYGFIFVGAGRVEVTYRAGQSGAIGDSVNIGAGTTGTFDVVASPTISSLTLGIAATAPAAGATSAVYVSGLITRVPTY